MAGRAPFRRPVFARVGRERLVAFTRLELLTVLSVLALLVVLACPVLGHGTHKTKALECMEHLRRLSLGWVLFANDHDGLLAASAATAGSAWVSGWLDWGTSSDNTNKLYLIDPRYAQLADYVGRDASLFKCPEDEHLSAQQRARHWKERVRSYSCSVVVGAGSGSIPAIDPIFAPVRSISEFRTPAPADCFVLLEEHPDSINDSAFFTPNLMQWLDLPASFHTRAANLTFADGHVEIHPWQSSNTVQRVTYSFHAPVARPGDPDIAWLRNHTPRK